MEKKQERKWFAPLELIALAVVLILCIMFLWYQSRPSGADATAQISYNGKIVKSIDLTTAQDTLFTLEENPKVQFRIQNHTIAFEDTDCPDKVCEKSGFLFRPGQVAICLPNKASLKILGDLPSDIDIVVE